MSRQPSIDEVPLKCMVFFKCVWILQRACQKRQPKNRSTSWKWLFHIPIWVVCSTFRVWTVRVATFMGVSHFCKWKKVLFFIFIWVISTQCVLQNSKKTDEIYRNIWMFLMNHNETQVQSYVGLTQVTILISWEIIYTFFFINNTSLKIDHHLI